MYMARENKVILLYLPSKASDEIQPLDVGAFSSLKDRFRQENRRYAGYLATALIYKIRMIESYWKASQVALLYFLLASVLPLMTLLCYLVADPKDTRPVSSDPDLQNCCCSNIHSCSSPEACVIYKTMRCRGSFTIVPSGIRGWRGI